MTSAPVLLLLLASLSAAFIMASGYKLRQTTTDVDCGKDKVYDFCGSACQPNCTHTEPGPCIEICIPGCYCKKGFVELGDSCVEKEKCDSCTGNTTYTEYGTACPFSCFQRPDEPIRCTPEFVVGCVCKPGYVLLDVKEKKCILFEDCPKD